MGEPSVPFTSRFVEQLFGLLSFVKKHRHNCRIEHVDPPSMPQDPKSQIGRVA